MKKSAVIFDIDGLLINSEPLWNKAATEIFRQYGIQLNQQQYAITTGLRSKEFVAYWLHQFNVPQSQNEIVEKKIIELALSLIDKEATLLNNSPIKWDVVLLKSLNLRGAKNGFSGTLTKFARNNSVNVDAFEIFRTNPHFITLGLKTIPNLRLNLFLNPRLHTFKGCNKGINGSKIARALNVYFNLLALLGLLNNRAANVGFIKHTHRCLSPQC